MASFILLPLLLETDVQEGSMEGSLVVCIRLMISHEGNAEHLCDSILQETVAVAVKTGSSMVEGKP